MSQPPSKGGGSRGPCGFPVFQHRVWEWTDYFAPFQEEIQAQQPVQGLDLRAITCHGREGQGHKVREGGIQADTAKESPVPHFPFRLSRSQEEEGITPLVQSPGCILGGT